PAHPAPRRAPRLRRHGLERGLTAHSSSSTSRRLASMAAHARRSLFPSRRSGGHISPSTGHCWMTLRGGRQKWIPPTGARLSSIARPANFTQRHPRLLFMTTLRRLDITSVLQGPPGGSNVAHCCLKAGRRQPGRADRLADRRHLPQRPRMIEARWPLERTYRGLADDFGMAETKPLTVLVTGATSGIGLAVSELLAAQGNRVFICARSGDNTAMTVKRFREDAREVSGRASDVTSVSQVHELVRAAVEQYGPIDVLVNNAGRSGGGLTAEISD